MTDTIYNGWTNYATWRVNLEIFDDDRLINDFDLRQEPHDLGQDLKEFADMLIDNGSGTSLAVDYARAFLSEVNWREIAEHLINDYAETN